MITLICIVAALWLIFGLRHWRSRSRRPTILKHRLSDKDVLVYVEKDGAFWVGLYTENETSTDNPEPDWYRSITRN
jgi:hypothetical protein